MRAVIQRVTHASVTIEGNVKSKIGQGYLILLGICDEDSMEDVNWLVKKIANLRVFGDENDVMNRSILDVKGEALVVSQFTLYASYKKGNRPSWFKAGSHEHSIPLYEAFCKDLSEAIGKPVGTGEFGADMKVELLNDGPVTICMDTKNKKTNYQLRKLRSTDLLHPRTRFKHGYPLLDWSGNHDPVEYLDHHPLEGERQDVELYLSGLPGTRRTITFRTLILQL